MSQYSFEAQVAEDQHKEHQQDGQEHEPETLALSSDDFAALEERVLRAVNLVKRERLARTEAEERANHADARIKDLEERANHIDSRLTEQSSSNEQLQNEINALRSERDQVRQRVERLLSQLDALEV